MKSNHENTKFLMIFFLISTFRDFVIKDIALFLLI